MWRPGEGGGDKWGHGPRGAGLWGRNSTLFAVLKTRESSNLDQSMPKNTYFLEKNCKKRLSVGGFAPEPPFASSERLGALPARPSYCYSSLLLQLCRVRF